MIVYNPGKIMSARYWIYVFYTGKYIISTTNYLDFQMTDAK